MRSLKWSGVEKDGVANWCGRDVISHRGNICNIISYYCSLMISSSSSGYDFNLSLTKITAAVNKYLSKWIRQYLIQHFSRIFWAFLFKQMCVQWYPVLCLVANRIEKSIENEEVMLTRMTKVYAWETAHYWSACLFQSPNHYKIMLGVFFRVCIAKVWLSTFRSCRKKKVKCCKNRTEKITQIRFLAFWGHLCRRCFLQWRCSVLIDDCEQFQ